MGPKSIIRTNFVQRFELNSCQYATIVRGWYTGVLRHIGFSDYFINGYLAHRVLA